jgi:DNA-binding IclR family transcriptional regulator
MVIYFDTMKINKTEAKILDFLSTRRESISSKEAAAALGIKKSNFSHYVKKLVRYGLIQVSKKKRKNFIIVESSFSIAFSSIRGKYPQLKPSDLLVGRIPNLFCFINFRNRIRLKDIDLPIATARRLLKKLRAQGMIYMPKKGEYQIRDEARPVCDFCHNVLVLAYTSEAKEELKGLIGFAFSFDSVKGLEAIFITNIENHPKRYWPTSYSVFHRFGLSLIQAGRYYYSNIKPQLPDVIIHTLAFHQDARTIMYLSALTIKNNLDPHRLLEKKQHFDIPDSFLDDFIFYLTSHGRISRPTFPDWNEVKELI